MDKGITTPTTDPNGLLPVPEAVRQAIAQADRIAVITHIAPDGDAIGSCLGLTHLLRQQGKEVIPVCQDPVPFQVNWFPGLEDLVTRAPTEVDLLISVDLSSPDRMGDAYSPEEHGQIPLLNIDHHITNTYFGTVNWVAPEAVAACEMVYHMAQAFHYPITPRIATYLLTGLLTDTRGLRTANVTTRVLRVVTHLVELGAPLAEIMEQTFNRKPLALIQLWGMALNHLRLEPEGIIWTRITQAMREAAGYEEENDGGLVSFILAAEEARVSAVFIERANGQVSVSLRSRPGYDVAQVAFALGGGGHPQAAGATLEGSLDAVQHRVLEALRAHLQGALLPSPVPSSGGS